MSLANLIRWSGLVAVLAGALLLVSDLLNLTVASGDLAEAATTNTYLANNGVRLFAIMLLLAGLTGLYVRQSDAAGALGLIGFLAAFAGTSLIIGASWTNTFVVPSVALEAPEFFAAGTTGTLGFGFTLTYALAALGWLVFGIATFRARVYPRAAAVVLVVGAALTFAPLPASGAVLDVAVAWLGLSLLSQKEAFAGQPERVK